MGLEEGFGDGEGEGEENVLEVLLELRYWYCLLSPMQKLLGYVDAENCRHPVYNAVCTVCNAIVSLHCILRAFSLLLSHYLVALTFSLLSLSHYHFLATARLEFPPSLFDKFPAFLFHYVLFYYGVYRLFVTFQ